MSEPATSGEVVGVQINPRLLLKVAQETAGLGPFLREAGRNPFVHAVDPGAKANIWIDLRESPRGDPLLHIVDDAKGMTAEDRHRFGNQLGYSTKGIGTGVRQTAFTIARYLECITVHADEPDKAFRITIQLTPFLLGEFPAKWNELPRAESGFASHLETEPRHGTQLMLSDFRAEDPNDPGNPKKMRSTRAQITEEKILDALPRFLPPDLAKSFVVNGKRFRPKPFEGYLLCHEPPKEKPGLGITSVEVRLSETASEGNWLVIGGTTGEIPMPNFLAGCREHNPELWVRISKIYRNRRLTGLIRMQVLERFPTIGRMHLEPAFYTSEAAQMTADELNRIAGKIEEGMRAYEAEPVSQVTSGLLDDFVARLHKAQGITTVTVPGGEGPPGDQEEEEPVAPRLMVMPISGHLEPWDGKGERDSLALVVTNPLEGEEFVWDDQDMGLLVQTTGRQVKVQSVAKESVYLITVRSEQNPDRECSITISVRRSTEQPAEDDAFVLLPMSTRMEVGTERYISIRSQGKTSGNYEWKVEPEIHRKKRVASLSVLPGGRKVALGVRRYGEYTVSCIDAEDSSLVAVCKVVAFTPEEDAGDEGGDDDGPGEPGDGGGTGDEDDERSTASGRSLHFDFEGKRYTFRLIEDPWLQEPFAVDPDNMTVQVSERVAASFDDFSVRQRHIVSCASEGMAAVFLDKGDITPNDHTRLAKLIGNILSMAIPMNGNNDKEATAS